MAGFNCDIFVVVSISLVFVLCSVNAFAQLADTMLCADETCSETISEGEARLAYRPRDENFLNLKKGDVVLVKSKNAGKKTHLWGGQVMGSLRFGFFPSSFIKEYMVIHDPPKVAVSIQDFLKGRSPQPTNDPFSNLVAEKQKITFEKSKKLDQENQQRFANSEDEKPPSVDEAVKVVTAGSQKDDVGLQQQENVRSTDVKMVSGESQDQLPNPGEGDEERSDEGREQMTKQDHHTKEEDAEERKENVEMKELNPEIANVINNNPNTESTDSNSSEKGTSTDHGNGKGTGEMPPDIAALLGDVKSVGDEQKIVDPGKVDENPQAAPESKEEAVEKELEPGKKDLKESEKEQHTEENKKIEENTSTDKSDEFQSSEMDNRKESSHTQKSVVQLANQDLQKDENKKEEPNTESHNTEENYTATDSPHNDKSSLSEKDQQEKPDEVGEQSTESNAEHATKTTVPLSEKDPNATEEKEHETKPLSTGENKLSPDSPQENQAETKSVSSENDQQEKPNDVEKQITENDVEHITKTTEPQPPESDPSADTGNQGLADNQSNENKIENIDPDTPTPVDQEKFVVDTVAEEDGTEQSKGEMDDSTVRASEIDQGVQDKVVDSAVLGHQSQSYKIDPDPAVLDDENVSDGTKSSHDSDSTLKEGTDKQSPTDNETNESDNDKTELNGQSQNLPSSSDINNADTDPKKMESEKGQIVDEKGKMNQDSEEEPSANQIEPEESDQAPSNEPTKTSDGGDKAEELNNKSSDTEQEQERNVNDDMEKHEIEKPDDSTIPPEKVEQESESHTNAEETRKSDDVASKDSDSSDEKLHSGHDEQEKKVSENDKNDKVNMAKLEEIDSVDEPEKTEDTQTQETVDGNERPTADNSPKQEGDDHKLSKTDPVNINSDEKNTETELSNDFPRQDSGIETKDSSKDNVVTTQSSETTEDSLDHDKNVEDISSQPKTEPENGDSKDGDQETAQNVGNGSEVQTDAEKVRDEPKGNMEQGDSQEDRQETAHSQSNDSQQGERNDQAVEKINENVVQQQSIHEQRGVVSEKTGTVQEDSDSSNVSDDGIAPDGNQNNLSDSNTEPGKAVEEHPQPTGKIDIDSSGGMHETGDSNFGDTDDPLLKWFRPKYGADFMYTNRDTEEDESESINSVVTKLSEVDGNDGVSENHSNVGEHLTSEFAISSNKNWSPYYLDDPFRRRTFAISNSPDLLVSGRDDEASVYEDKNGDSESVTKSPNGDVDIISLDIHDDKSDWKLFWIEDHETPNVIDDPFLKRTICLNSHGIKDEAVNTNENAENDSETHMDQDITKNDLKSDWGLLWIEQHQTPNVIDDPFLKRTIFLKSHELKDKSPSSVNAAGNVENDSVTPTEDDVVIELDTTKHDLQSNWGLLWLEHHQTPNFIDDPFLLRTIHVKPHIFQVKDNLHQDDDIAAHPGRDLADDTEKVTDEENSLDESDSPDGVSLRFINNPFLQKSMLVKPVSPKYVFIISDTKTESTEERVDESMIMNDIIHDENEYSSYFNDPLLKWILPSTTNTMPLLESDQPIDSDADELDVTLENLGKTEVSEEDDVSEDEYESSEENSIENVDSDVAKQYNEFYRPLETTVQTHHESSDMPDWISLRGLLSSFQDLLEDMSLLRIGIGDIKKDLNLLKKVKPDMMADCNSMAKIFKQNVTNVENQIYANIQFLRKRLYTTSTTREDPNEADEAIIPKYKATLLNITVKVEKLQDEMNTIHDTIAKEIYSDSDDTDDIVNEINEKATDEILKLQQKLDDLNKKLSDKDSESSNLVQKMEKEAEEFKSRISELEKSVLQKHDEQKNIYERSREQEEKMEEKLAEFQTSLQEKNSEQIKAAHEETRAVKEKLRDLEESLKLNVEADKPFVERIITLEEELTSRKQGEMEKTRKEKFEATLLRSKIQALERQLKKRFNHDNSKMLMEADDLKEKVRSLENSLTAKIAEEKDELSAKEKESELRERIELLEKELKDRLESVDISARDEQANELKARVQAMEDRLKAQIEQLDAQKTQTVDLVDKSPKAKSKSIKKSKKKNIKKKEVMEFLNTFFFSQNDHIETTNQTPVLTNQTDVISTNIFDENMLQSVNTDFKCIMEPSKRRACGAKHFSKDFCSALQCCWSPVMNDPSVPPCYFSLLQMENSKNKELHQSALSNDKKSEERSGEYNVLHEGKVVNWDETLDEKSASEKKVGWDESLGAETDNEHILEALEIAKKEKVVDATRDNSIKDEIDSDTVTKQPSGEDAEPELTPPTTVTTLETLVTEQVTPETDTSQQFTETVTTPTPDLQLETTLPPQHVDTTDSILAYETNKTAAQEVKSHLSVSTEKSDEKDNVDPDEEETLHAESFWLRLLLVFSKLPYDIIYILEPLFNAWITLLPEEYRNDVYGVSWTIIISTFFCGLILIWLLICRSQSVKRKHRDQSTAATIQELKTQLENLSQEKVQAENELRTKQNEVEIQKGQVETVTEEKNATLAMKTGLENSLRELNKETETLKREMQILNQNLQDKDNAMQEVLTNSQQVETSLLAQKEAITKYEGEIKQLRGAITKHENNQKTAEASNEKLKERIKTLEKAKSETKKEGKTLKDQIEKLNNRIGELQERLDNEIEDSENKKQEIDVLKDCILQFKGVQEYLNDEGEDGETEEAIIKQKEKMKSMLDVANVKSVLRQTETEKLHVTYELEAERKSRQDTEGKVSELEATIKGNEAIKDELERQKRMLESKLTVMEEFYAKREVEIQSKLGLEQSKRESNASMLEDQQQQRLEILQQLDAYKKMSEDAKKKYEDSDRQHKQEILSFEKKSHDNWLACRDAERKTEEANKQISHLQLELTDMRRRLHDSHDRDPIIRPRPERYGPPGAPPLFGPPRRGPPPPGVPDSPLHFRSGPPPDADRRSPPPHHRRPPSPGGSIPGDRPPSRPDRPPSRPDRPPSTHSLPPMDRRSMPGPPPGPGQPYSNTPPGREFRPYRDAMPPRGPPRDRAYPPPPGARMGSGPANSSPYMERPPIPSSQSPGPRSQNFTQSSLHATPPQSTGDGLRNDGYQPPPAASTGPPPPGSGPHGGSNPFRRSKP
ncbi:uncharacterized protein LOC120335233 isoform X1 [Styela clava]